MTKFENTPIYINGEHQPGARLVNFDKATGRALVVMPNGDLAVLDGGVEAHAEREDAQDG